MNINSSLVGELRDKEYRDAYVASQIRMSLPIQIRELRKSRDMTQPQLAELSGMTQPRISEIERPGERRLNIETLLRIASAFDIALQIKFVPFEELIDWSEGVDLENFSIAPFTEELKSAEETQFQEAHEGALVAALGSPSGVHIYSPDDFIQHSRRLQQSAQRDQQYEIERAKTQRQVDALSARTSEGNEYEASIGSPRQGFSVRGDGRYESSRSDSLSHAGSDARGAFRFSQISAGTR